MLFNKNKPIHPLKKSNGFTLIEVMIVMAIIGILATISIANYNPLKRTARDTIALADARNLVEAVVDAILSDESVTYDMLPDGTGPVGNFDVLGNPRPPVFVLSPGVVATITGKSDQLPGDNTLVNATIYHPEGTPGKQFIVLINEQTGDYSLP